MGLLQMSCLRGASLRTLMIHIGIRTFLLILCLLEELFLRLRFDRYNLAPNHVRRLTVSKYIGDDINLLNKDKTMSTSCASQVLPIDNVANDGDVDDTIDNYQPITDDE
ncbi:hypothetical protein E3N88_18450 [Mikania micrantha]|uniref:Uncharacterized protein n=1 Tax=Mikania micrantha TaxID=192012 RepID=A0A5N6NKU6_9ASTR|nr:hypothetical protein E3N88_18450 [Mikania micrantha]